MALIVCSFKVSCRPNGRPRSLAEVAQLKGMAITPIARMLVHVFVRCVGHGRAERGGRGRGLLACACLKGPTEVALCSQ